MHYCSNVAEFKKGMEQTNTQKTSETLIGSEPDYVKLRPTYRSLPNNQSL